MTIPTIGTEPLVDKVAQKPPYHQNTGTCLSVRYFSIKETVRVKPPPSRPKLAIAPWSITLRKTTLSNYNHLLRHIKRDVMSTISPLNKTFHTQLTFHFTRFIFPCQLNQKSTKQLLLTYTQKNNKSKQSKYLPYLTKPISILTVKHRNTPNRSNFIQDIKTWALTGIGKDI